MADEQPMHIGLVHSSGMQVGNTPWVGSLQRKDLCAVMYFGCVHSSWMQQGQLQWAVHWKMQ
jgi:hypothetical protein